jgi:hypothetical protein
MALSDLRNVDWAATVKLAVIRGFASALVLVVTGAVFGLFSGPGGGGAGGALSFLLFWTFGASIGGICYIWMLRALSATLGQSVGIVVTVCSLMQILVVVLVAAGDPLVCLLNRQMPQLLDLADFKLFNFVAVIFVRSHDQIDVAAY